MNILIIENEIYLAQSISAKLRNIGHECTICISVYNIKDISYEVILLSTNVKDEDVNYILNTYENSIIILLASYISNDTVLKLLNHGARDYILKPFMIDDLIKKINHYTDYEILKKNNDNYEKYFSYIFKDINNIDKNTDIKLPVFLLSNNKKYMDSFAYKYAKNKKEILNFITLSNPKAIEEIKSYSIDSLLYIVDFHMLKEEDKEIFFDLIIDKKVIISNTTKIDTRGFPTLELIDSNNMFVSDEITTIKDYVKHVIKKYQYQITDTELSKKLGISRKSIWEKRKKYGINKEK